MGFFVKGQVRYFLTPLHVLGTFIPLCLAFSCAPQGIPFHAFLVPGLLLWVIWVGVLYCLERWGYRVMGTLSFVLFLFYLVVEVLGVGKPISLRGILACASGLIAVALIFVLLEQKMRGKGRILIYVVPMGFFLFLFFIPSAYLTYFILFGTYVGPDFIYNTMESNHMELYESFVRFGLFEWLAIFGMVMSFFCYLLVRERRGQKRIPIKTPMVFALLIVLIANTYDDFGDIWIVNYLQFFQKNHKEEMKMLKTTNQAIRGLKEEKGETYIVVIGESLNKNHMSLYGYQRPTTPSLSKEENILVFQKAYANNISSRSALLLALTEANQYNKKKYYHSPTTIAILKGAEMETYWITNHPLYGLLDSSVSIVAKQSDHTIPLNEKRGLAPQFDGASLEKVREIVEKESEKNRVVFVHLQGSHFEYCSRYPKEFNHFTGGKKQVDCYDNSVLYNDFVIKSMLDILKGTQGARGLIYYSDHGEDVLGGLQRLGGKFSYAMVEIPLIVWFSQEYKERYPEKVAVLEERRERIFSSDLVHEMLIGIFNIKTERYDESYDFSSRNFSLGESDMLILHGKKKIMGPSTAYDSVKK